MSLGFKRKVETAQESGSFTQFYLSLEIGAVVYLEQRGNGCTRGPERGLQCNAQGHSSSASSHSLALSYKNFQIKIVRLPYHLYIIEIIKLSIYSFHIKIIIILKGEQMLRVARFVGVIQLHLHIAEREREKNNLNRNNAIFHKYGIRKINVTCAPHTQRKPSFAGANRIYRHKEKELAGIPQVIINSTL